MPTATRGPGDRRRSRRGERPPPDQPLTSAKATRGAVTPTKTSPQPAGSAKWAGAGRGEQDDEQRAERAIQLDADEGGERRRLDRSPEREGESSEGRQGDRDRARREDRNQGSESRTGRGPRGRRRKEPGRTRGRAKRRGYGRVPRRTRGEDDAPRIRQTAKTESGSTSTMATVMKRGMTGIMESSSKWSLVCIYTYTSATARGGKGAVCGWGQPESPRSASAVSATSARTIVPAGCSPGASRISR